MSGSGSIVRLGDQSASSAVMEIGAKAQSLSRLMAAGIPIPVGVCIPAEVVHEYDALVGRELLVRRLESLIDAEDTSGLVNYDAELDGVVALTKATARIAEAVEASWGLLDRPLIARSSAVQEDGARLSFAGQFESVSAIRSRAALGVGVRACYFSILRARVAAYLAAMGSVGMLRELRMAVLVQQEVSGTRSGVLFTQGRTPGTMWIEYGRGHGSSVVSGTITPVGVELSWDTGAPRAAPPSVLNELGRLTSRLAAFGRTAEEVLGGPQDIEWTADGEDNLWLVQSRPISKTLLT